MSYWTDCISFILGPDYVKHQSVLHVEGNSSLVCLLIINWSMGKLKQISVSD